MSKSQKGQARSRSRQPRVACPWKHLPEVWCAACEQSTHCVDKDSSPGNPVWVQWTQTKYKADPHAKKKGGSIQYPCGTECNACKKTRINNFLGDDEEPMPLEDLNKIRTNKPDVDEKFCKLRGHRVRGEKGEYKTASNQFKVSEIVKEQKAFHKKFKSGRFEGLADFCEARGLPYSDDPHELDEICRHISQTLGLDVVEDDEGSLGIQFENDKPNSYSYERGVEKNMKVRKVAAVGADEVEQQAAKNGFRRSYKR